MEFKEGDYVVRRDWTTHVYCIAGSLSGECYPMALPSRTVKYYKSSILRPATPEEIVQFKHDRFAYLNEQCVRLSEQLEKAECEVIKYAAECKAENAT